MPDFYGTFAGFSAYHSARNHPLHNGAHQQDDVESALLVTSEWLDARFRGRYGGLKTAGRVQVRDWPRTGAWDIYGNTLIGIPVEVENATYEGALLQVTQPGVLNVDYKPGKYKSVNIQGAVAVEYTQFFSLEDVQTRFAMVEQALLPVLTGNAPVSFVGSSVRG